MPRSSAELTENRKEEIIDACARLYGSLNYNEITIKEISQETSFSRPSIYNYFETKEEIFLALLTREYRAWAADLEQIAAQGRPMDLPLFADSIAESVAQRKTLLKIQAMNLYEIEENSRLERLVEYKKVFLETMEAFQKCLKGCFPAMTAEEMEQFRYAFFPFMYGIYPYVFPTEKQCQAMEQVGIPYTRTTIFAIVYQFIIGFLRKEPQK